MGVAGPCPAALLALPGAEDMTMTRAVAALAGPCALAVVGRAGPFAESAINRPPARGRCFASHRAEAARPARSTS